MQQVKVVGTTPLNRENYEVLGEHRQNSLLEFTMTGFEIFSVVISKEEGNHRHVMAKRAIQFLLNGGTIHGLKLGEGNKLALTSTLGKRQIERHCFASDMIYSCCLDMNEALLVGLSIQTYEDRVQDIQLASSIVTGYRFCMMQNIFDLTPEETAEWLKNVYVPELSVVNGNIYINDQSIISRIHDVNARMVTGDNYIELVSPEDIVYVKQK